MVKREAAEKRLTINCREGSSGTERVRIADLGRYESAAAAVVDAVAEAKDADPTALRPLFEWIDPDALDRVVGDATVQFRYVGYRVTASDESVVVRSLAD